MEEGKACALLLPGKRKVRKDIIWKLCELPTPPVMDCRAVIQLGPEGNQAFGAGGGSSCFSEAAMTAVTAADAADMVVVMAAFDAAKTSASVVRPLVDPELKP